MASLSRAGVGAWCIRALSTRQASRLSSIRFERCLATSRTLLEPQEKAARGSDDSGASPTAAKALQEADPSDNNLLSPVHVAEDPNGVLNERHPAVSLLSNSALVVERQLEMMNIMVGFEQANKYVIMDPHGNHVGFMAEQELGIGSSLARQFLRTHRRFTAYVFDRNMKEVLRFHRPFSYISSRIGIYDPVESTPSSVSLPASTQRSSTGALSTNLDPQVAQTSSLNLAQMRRIGEAQQQWAPLRRKYNLFLARNPESEALRENPQKQAMNKASQLQLISQPDVFYEQFAYVDEPFLSWDFSLMSSDSQLIGSVSRNWRGFGRELFTDTGAYALRMDSTGLAEDVRHIDSGNETREGVYGLEGGMTPDQRAVMLATAVTIDFDYFSRNRGGVGGFMPLWLGGTGGTEAAAGTVGAEAATASGAEASAAAPSAIVRGAGADVGGTAAEGAVTGAGAMAGYEAMQHAYGKRDDGASPVASGPEVAAPSQGNQMQQGHQSGSPQPQGQEEVWGEEFEWPGENRSGGNSSNPDGGGHGGGGGGGDGGGDFDVGDWF